MIIFMMYLKHISKIKIVIVECDGKTWGVDCLQPCDCVLEHTEKCNNVDGSCQCKEGWERQKCDIDVDECDNPNPCNDPLKKCTNTEGSFTCACKSGCSIDATLTCHGRTFKLLFSNQVLSKQMRELVC